MKKETSLGGWQLHREVGCVAITMYILNTCVFSGIRKIAICNVIVHIHVKWMAQKESTQNTFDSGCVSVAT